MRKIKDIAGKKFGTLIVLAPTEKRGKNGLVYWDVYDYKEDKIKRIRTDNIQKRVQQCSDE